MSVTAKKTRVSPQNYSNYSNDSHYNSRISLVPFLKLHCLVKIKLQLLIETLPIHSSSHTSGTHENVLDSGILSLSLHLPALSIVNHSFYVVMEYEYSFFSLCSFQVNV